MSDTEISKQFQIAVTAYDKAFLDAEKALFDQGDAAAQWLNEKANDSSLSSFERFVASTIAASIHGKSQQYSAAMDAVRAKVARSRQTPAGTPQADILAGLLSQYGDAIDNQMALHLLKETYWPEWLALGVIIYLGYYAGASTLPAIDQFLNDLKTGKRGPGGKELQNSSGNFLANFVEAISLVRIVIENDSFKENLSNINTATDDQKLEAQTLAVFSALSAITADNSRAKQLEDLISNTRTTFLNPILQATEGEIEASTVRAILAKYILGGDVN